VRPAEAREQLRRLLAEKREPFPLDRAALLLAVDEYPNLAPESYEARLDAYAERVGLLTAGEGDPRRRLGALRRVIFEDEGFHGNRDAYYDVRNSYLNEVLDRKLGIPISLAAVVLAVGSRLRWPMAGVNFPAHFLVRYAAPAELLAVDPFHGGLILGVEELAERWRFATAAPAPVAAEMLRPAEPRMILLRMLNNIRLVHTEAGHDRLAELAVEKMRLVHSA